MGVGVEENGDGDGAFSDSGEAYDAQYRAVGRVRVIRNDPRGSRHFKRGTQSESL